MDLVMGPPKLPIVTVGEHAVVDARLAQVLAGEMEDELPGETYADKREQRIDNFRAWLSSYRPQMYWSRARPEHVVAYLISLDATARTVVHLLSCPSLGLKGRPNGCSCPTRAKASSLETVTGVLRGEFSSKVSPHRYATLEGRGNPCHSKTVTVDDYIYKMAQVQQRAGVTTQKATVLEEESLVLLLDYLLEMRDNLRLSASERLRAMGDRSALAIQNATGGRAGDILRSLRTAGMHLTPLSLNYRQQWGKTIRTENAILPFDLPVRDDPRLCPSCCLIDYVTFAESMNVDLTKNEPSDPSGTAIGYLYRQYDDNNNILPTAGDYASMNRRVVAGLKKLNLYKSGHSLHGVRRAFAIDSELRLVTPTAVASFVGWARRHMPRVYSQLNETLGLLMPVLERAQQDRPRSISEAYGANTAAASDSEKYPAVPLHLYRRFADGAHLVSIVVPVLTA